MPAEIVPFPLTRRRAFIRKHAARVAAATPATGEKLLAHQLRIQRATMAKRGIASEIVEAECKALENAISAELWRVVLQPGGAA
jgi:hypothetical protein